MLSDQIKKGVNRAPNRSLLFALGLTEEEMSRPLVGIVSSHNEIVPGHMNIDKVVEAVKAGVRAAGGTPIMFPAIAVCDGIANIPILCEHVIERVGRGSIAIFVEWIDPYKRRRCSRRFSSRCRSGR